MDITNKMMHLALILLISLSASAHSNKELQIVYIGNSITQGALLASPLSEAPPVKTSEWLEESGVFKRVSYNNQGVSGNTTVDFLPLTATCFIDVVTAASEFKPNKNSQLLFSIMLGTNDSAMTGTNEAPVSNKQYATNLKAIIDELLYLYPTAKFILHQPLWYSPNTYNYSMYLEPGLKRLKSYTPEIENIVSMYNQRHPGQVYMGDQKAASYFEDNYKALFTPEKGNAGIFYLHPNKEGAKKLAEFWGQAILNIFETK